MSQFYDQSSLVFLPSGYKDGKLYSQKPLSTSGELSFSRGSDIEATRVAANGYIEKAQVNLLLQSNTFSSATWVKGGSLTSGQSGYDGSSNAWLYTTTAAGQRIEQSTTITGVQTISVYAKAGNLNWILLNIGGGVFGAYFDLANGVVGSTQSASGGVTIDTKIQAIGSGWYRISVSGNYSSASSFRIYTASADLVTAAGTVYIQDAQLNYGLVAQDYQETITAAVVSGITDNMPRLSYDPANPTCPSLLLEPSRTNLIVQSEYLNTWWGRTATSVTDNATTSPEGVTNAGKIVESATTASHLISRSGIAISSGSAYTLSAFVKAGGRNTFRLFYDDGVGSGYAFFNVSTGAKGTQSGVTADIEDYGNGWHRCYITFTAASTSTYIQVLLSEDDETTNYAGNGTDGIYLYGAQLELGSYVSSMIPTYGSSATRTADACSKTGISSLIGQTEGTVYIEMSPIGGTTSYTERVLRITGGTDEVGIQRYGNNRIVAYGISGGVSSWSVDVPNIFSAGQVEKIAIGYKLNDVAVYVNGVQIGTDTSAAMFTSLANLFFANDASAGLLAPQNVNQALLFKTRLSNADLATLTSL